MNEKNDRHSKKYDISYSDDIADARRSMKRHLGLTMGVEDFRVRMVVTISPGLVAQRLQVMHAFEIDETFRVTAFDEHYLKCDTDLHLIECELRAEGEGALVSLRFALCHPSSIDAYFANLVVNLMESMQGVTTVLDAAGEAGAYQSIESSECRMAIMQAISQARDSWRVLAGTETAKMSCRDALLRYIMRTQHS